MAGVSSDISAQLLLVEDDLKLGELVQRFLSGHGFAVSWARDGASAERLCQHHLFDLIICDVMLPDAHGFTLFERLQRDSATPCLFLTALGDSNNHIDGLERGAVDYLIKPIEPELLLARINLHLRKKQQSQSHRVIDLDALQLNATTRVALSQNTEIVLTRQEFELLWHFAQYPNTIMHRDMLFSAVTERDYDGQDRIIDGRISRLRKKLETVASNPWTIRTVWGRGYMLCKKTVELDLESSASPPLEPKKFS